MRTQWGDERQSSPTRRPPPRLRPGGGRRPEGRGGPRVHRVDRDPGHRPRAAQPGPLPGHRPVRQRRPGRPPRRAGVPAEGADRRRRPRGRRAGAPGGAHRPVRHGRAAPRDPRRTGGGHPARRLRLPHRAQRHHRLHRTRAHARRPGGGPHPRAGQQGVAHRRRPAGQGAGQAGPDHPGRLRARRPLPGAGRRHPRRRAQAGRHRLRRPVPGPYQGRAGGRHRRGRPRPPHLGHGPGDHDQLRDARQQGPGGDRGPPALRHSLRPH